ncbi:ligase-associated DNA damage response DEXH box helicase [Sphingoaurantiacus capsulatus]|uniref:Ligase-associated DNA damage response DEXH box helicase n=1 Tax=Sphingoaurantiacus capsulatus TaxID=1771310 RepID=A0ABV7X979_9SPHN
MVESVTPPAIVAEWLASRGWSLRRHQAEMLAAGADGSHALLVAPTGAGKTLAGFLPTLAELIANPSEDRLHTIYVSPLKALAVDVQRNLLTPITEMGLPIRVETRTGDTPSDRKARQRERPPQILLTTPESLSLLVSYPDSFELLKNVSTIIIDEIHAFANGKRGDLLNLAMARMQAINPRLRRVGLSATIADPEAYQGWLAPDADAESVRLVQGDPGEEPHIGVLVPEGRIPWAGHTGLHAAREVYKLIAQHKLTIVFVNTRSVAELTFRDLWNVNDDALPIGIHHGSLAPEARRKTEAAMAAGKLRAIVATASLDLGLDWGDVDLVVQMGAPKGSSRLLQRIGRANHRMDEASKAVIVPGNRFEYLEAVAAVDAVEEHELDQEYFRPGSYDVLAQHLMGVACAAPFEADAMYHEIRSSAPYAGLPRAMFDKTLSFVENGGYALRAYDRFKRLTLQSDGLYRVSHPRLAHQHRLNAGVIVEAAMMNVVLGRRRGRRLGQVEEWFGSQLRVGDSFMFAGQTLEVTGFDAADINVTLSRGDPRVPMYAGARQPLTTNLADRVQRLMSTPTEWDRMPPDVHEWLQLQQEKSQLPAPGMLLVETFERDNRHYIVIYGFEGRNAHQTLGMLMTQRMERAGLKPLGFVGSDYVLSCWSLEPVTDPKPLLSPEVLEDELAEWMAASPFLKKSFREVAIIAGLIERQHPGKRKTGAQVSFSSDLIYDVLKKYEPDHLLIQAAWADAQTRLSDIARLTSLLERSQHSLVHRTLDRVSPLAVPILLDLGRQRVQGEATDDALLIEADAIIAEAME